MPAPRDGQQYDTDAQDADSSVIPTWLSEWPGLTLGAAGFVALLLIAFFGHVHGAVYGWVLLAVAICVIAALWGWGYFRRRVAAKARRDRRLCERLEMATVDQMDGAQFERYCVDLLPHCGYSGARRVGHLKGQQAVDITAEMPDGTLLAVECKRRKVPVQPKVVNELLGAVTAGRYQGWTGMVISSAPATSGAKALAAQVGIIMVDRPVLENWMGHVRTQFEPGNQPYGVRLANKLTAAVLCCAAIVLTVTFLVAGSPRSAIAAPTRHPGLPTSAVSASRPTAPDPASIAQAYFAAISHHDWPQMWQLGGKNLGTGPYASYPGMVSAFRLIQRDVLTVLHRSGPSVTGRYVAYETTGVVQTYDFSLTIRAGTITSGHQTLLATSHPRG